MRRVLAVSAVVAPLALALLASWAISREEPAPVTAGPTDDRALNQAAKEGLDRLAAASGLELLFLQASPENCRDAITKADQEAFSLIVLLGEEFLPIASDMARILQSSRLVCIGPEEASGNVEVVSLRLDQAAYLCGVLAGLSTQTQRWAMVGDELSQLQESTLAAFENGARSVNRRYHASRLFAHDGSAAAIQQAVNAAISNGADMIFQATGRAGCLRRCRGQAEHLRLRLLSRPERPGPARCAGVGGH